MLHFVPCVCQIRTTLKGEGENIQSCKRDHRKLLSRLQTIFGNFHLVHLIYSSTPSPSKPPDHRAKFLKDQALAPAASSWIRHKKNHQDWDIFKRAVRRGRRGGRAKGTGGGYRRTGPEARGGFLGNFCGHSPSAIPGSYSEKQSFVAYSVIEQSHSSEKTQPKQITQK